ncbi:sterol desaturase family protein [Spirosoma spitsbergense]|uniref:sterol desaturase family protein n=1 Tax=Spirosoma spitsbergense TaxID=431554 RepID=UPI00037F01F9|nr:sterol desaturase family protein [Spirosoma spitsbergense]
MNTSYSYITTLIDGYRNYADYFVHELLSPNWHNYFYWLVGISAFVWLLELLFPWRTDQPVFRHDFWLDLFYLFFNYFLFSLIGYNALSDVGVQAFNDFLGWFGIANLVAIRVGALPVWGQLVVLFLVRDFVQWHIHRLLHRTPWMWEFHKVHHSVEQMGFAAHLRYHWMETIIYRTLEYIPLAMIGFGIQDFILVHLFTLAIGHLNHANIYLPIGPLKYVFNNPQMHLWHHAEKLPRQAHDGVNFGITLSVWDFLYRTAYVPYEGSHIKLGFQGVRQFPKTFLGQLLYPWRKPVPTGRVIPKSKLVEKVSR